MFSRLILLTLADQVLTRRVGTPMMLALIYSEIANRLLRWGYIDFQVQMQLPADPITLPEPQAVRDQGKNSALLPETTLLCQYRFHCAPNAGLIRGDGELL
jgi:hypothetical protein